MEFLGEADEVVLEYLLFRGFTDTFRVFHMERGEDRLQSLNADMVAAKFLSFADSQQLRPLLELWSFLEDRCFSNLDGALLETAARLRSGVFQRFLVKAKIAGRQDCIHEFFADEVVQLGECWFGLAYCKDPTADPRFARYFDEEWMQLFSVSLHNFLGEVFRTQKLPKLLAFPIYMKKMQSFEAELKAKDRELERLRKELEQTRNLLENRKLAQKLVTESQGRARSDFSSSDQSSEDKEEGNDDATAIVEHASRVNMCRFAQEGAVLASASDDCTARIWDTTNAELRRVQTVYSPSQVLSLDWHGESLDLLAIGNASGTVMIWNAKKRARISEALVSSENHLPFVTEVRFCSRRQIFATVCCGQTISKTDEDEHRTTGSAASRKANLGSLFSPFGASKAQPGSRGAVLPRSVVRLWNSSTIQLQGSFDVESYNINSVCFNHNGSLLICGGSDGCVRVFDVSQSSCIMKFSALGPEREDLPLPITRVCLNADETGVITLLADGTIGQWSLHKVSSTPLFNFPGASHVLNRSGLGALLETGDLSIDPSKPSEFLICSPTSKSSLFSLDSAKPSLKPRHHISGARFTSIDFNSNGEFCAATNNALMLFKNNIKAL